MTGRELRLLRLLRRGPLYEGSFQVVCSDAPLAKYRTAARSLVRQGYATADISELGPPAYTLTAAGEELAEAMTP